MRIKDALARYLVQLEADGRSPSTIDQYRRQIGQMVDFFREHEVDEVTHEDVARFLASRVARTRRDGAPKKATSMNVLRSCVRTYFSYLHQAGYVRANAARLVRRGLCSAGPPRGMSEAQQASLLAVLARGRSAQARRDHMLFHLMLATGIRIGSTLALRVEDVDLDRGELLLRRAKGDRIERVYLGRAIREHLAAYLRGRRMGPLFLAWGNRAPSARHVQRRLQDWCAKAGIRTRVTNHSLRHSFAQHLYRRTGNLLIVRAALGHRSLSSTIVYAHVDNVELRAAMEGLLPKR